MDTKAITEIIEKAKAGDQPSKGQVIKLMQENGYMKIISKYLYMNRLLEPDDVKSEFWIGVILALPKVKTDIGDPLFYLAWQGVNRVKKELKNKIGRGVQFTCLDCGWVGRLYRKNHEYQCRKCGSTNYETHQKEINITTLINKPQEELDNVLEVFVRSAPNQLSIDIKIDNEYLKSTLTTQESRVFTLIIEEGINRTRERNYLQTIGDILGISAQCVSAYLKKIRRKSIELRKEAK